MAKKRVLNSQKPTNFMFNFNNKLNNHIFTTVRLSDDKRWRVGEIHEIHLKRKYVFHAKIIDVHNINLKSIPDVVCMVDAALNKNSFINTFCKIYDKLPDYDGSIAIVVYERLNDNRENSFFDKVF